MKIYTSYKVKIKKYNKIFAATLKIYRAAVDFYINVCLNEWEALQTINSSLKKVNYVEKLSHHTKNNVTVKYDFDKDFYKFPTYLRRAAIMYAIGEVSSYKSKLKSGEKASPPKAGRVYPCFYRDNMYKPNGDYSADIKIFTRNTWDWITVSLRKSDVDYIQHHCQTREESAPSLKKHGKEWFLEFAFKEDVLLTENNNTIVAVDLGINNAATISVMQKDGTILGRKFLSLPREQDSLMHSINRVKKAQQHGNYKAPRLWAKVKGINKDITVKTAQFIIDTAVSFNADVIVFEYLDTKGKKYGSNKQRIHMWKCKSVQKMVIDKAHRLGMHVNHICAWNTSKLAYDGSGYVSRDSKNYSICTFPNGKKYNCDLSASYNIGARYFIKEILKSLPATARLQLEAKVPQVCKRSTCTLSTLVNLNAEIIVL